MDERRKRGRPTIGGSEPSTDLHLTLENSLYDRLYVEAQFRRVSAPTLVREILKTALGIVTSTEFRNLN